MQDANVQQATQEEVVRRQQKAIEEIGAKYEAGEGGKLQAKKDAKARRIAAEERMNESEDRAKKERENQNPNSDDEDGDDDDAELRAIRDQRMKQIKASARDRIENISKGHGSYREIVSDEFLKEMCSSERVICHFYHRDFERCKIMDMHLQKLASRHLETKFVKIDAEKAPFFTAKLLIQTIPTLVFFFDGVGKEKIIGFEGLMDDMPEGREDEWPTILLARRMGASGIIDDAKIVDDDGIEAAHRARLEEMRKSVFSGIRADGLAAASYVPQEEDDFDLDNIEDIEFQG
eukprot:GSChrysophyteH1.ASY1.ANO1.2333.1 assembled CDS